MRIVVFADSHGKTFRLKRIMEAQPKADCYIHLGDGYDDALELRAAFPKANILAVVGNCDYNSLDVDTKLFEAAGKRIVYTHGHRFGVNGSMDRLVRLAADKSADIVLFGHTHIPFFAVKDDVYYLNPGNANAYDAVKFATIDILKDNVVCNLTELK
ncbi:MAG: YfcE family phosphodiesterase [Ruminococcaceae bacterium]|nr:YfcE family phosphodiesterase [Oscillospiraceae bacterium]